MTQIEARPRPQGLMLKLLLRMCRSPAAPDYPMAEVDYDQDRALDTLRAVFPDVDKEIVGRRVIDFGCGKGYQAVGYALAGAKSVVGVEIIEELMALSKARVEQYGAGGQGWRLCVLWMG